MKVPFDSNGNMLRVAPNWMIKQDNPDIRYMDIDVFCARLRYNGLSPNFTYAILQDIDNGTLYCMGFRYMDELFKSNGTSKHYRNGGWKFVKEGTSYSIRIEKSEDCQ